MKNRILNLVLGIITVICLCLAMVSPVMADELNTQPPHTTMTPEEQYQAFQHGQTGSSAPVTTLNNKELKGYMESLAVGIVPSDEYALKVQQEAHMEIIQQMSQPQQPAIYYKTVAEWKTAGSPSATWTQNIVIGSAGP